MQNISLFKILTKEQQEALVTSLTTLKFFTGSTIVNDGDPGNLFYIIKEGNVSVVKNGEEIRQMGKGDYFGEQALLYTQFRTATIICITNVTCLAIGGDALTQALGNQLQKIIYKNSLKIALEIDENMKKLTQIQINNIIAATTVESYKHKQTIIKEGTPFSMQLHIIVKGSAISIQQLFPLFTCINSKEFTNKSDNCFTADINAVEEVDIAIITLENFEAAIEGDYLIVKSRNELFSALKQIPVLESMPIQDLKSIISVLKYKVFNSGDVIVQENEPGDSFFMIKSGEVVVQKDSVLKRHMTKYDYFGERSLLFNNPRSATVIAITQVECWYLQRDDFLGIFNESAKIQLLKRIDLQDDSMQLEELVIVKQIGKGMFGNVFLVVHREKKTLYALKCISRKKIKAYQVYSNIILERKILLQVDHQMIMKLIKTFKDNDRVYFLLEFVTGLDMFDVMRKLNILNDSDSRFYTACLITILEHLHSRDIVYRDLKPENIVIDQDGYPKLIDFGISKIVNGRTFTLVGTPHYMPPEVISGKGYGITADYWSLGIILYEFLCGVVPFGEDEEEPYAIYEKILQRKINFPS